MKKSLACIAVIASFLCASSAAMAASSEPADDVTWTDTGCDYACLQNKVVTLESMFAAAQERAIDAETTVEALQERLEVVERQLAGQRRASGWVKKTQEWVVPTEPKSEAAVTKRDDSATEDAVVVKKATGEVSGWKIIK